MVSSPGCRTSLLLILLLVSCTLLLSCSSTPPAPTSEEYFAAFKTNLQTQDYRGALKALDRVAQATDNPARSEQARVLRVILLTSMAEGDRQMAELYDTGGKQPAAFKRQTDFVRVRGDYYRDARGHLIAAMEEFMKQRSALAPQPLTLDLPFPAVSGGEDPALAKLEKGVWVTDDDRNRLELGATRAALSQLLTRLVQAKDAINAQETFKQGPVEVKPCGYLVETSRAIVDASDIFKREALDDPRFRRIAYEMSQDNIEAAMKLMGSEPDPQTLAHAKELKLECDRELKTLGR